MKRSLLIAILISTVVAAQEPVDSAIIAKIRDEGLKRPQAMEYFTHFTEDIGPRLAGSPAFKVAVDYARDQFTKIGLANPRLDPWEFGRGWTLEKFSLEMTGPRYMPLVGFPEAWSPSTAGELSATPLYLGGKSQAELEGMRDQIKGAIVLSQPIMTNFEREDRKQPTLYDTPVAIGQPRPTGVTPPLVTPQIMTRILRESGAALVLRPNRGEHGTLFVLGRDNGEGSVPSVVVSAEQYNMLARMIQRGLPVKLRANVQARFHTDDRNSYNVLAEIPGTDPALRDEIVMIGAHLDSWHSATGAADNADGAATVMEAMRILKSIGARPRRTIRVAIWGGEEEGLLGSAAYAKKYLAGDANKSAREKFDVYFNIDPGTGPIYGWYMEGNEAAKSIFDAWLVPFKDLEGRRNILPGIGNTDHLSFTRLGLAGFNPIQDYTNYDVRVHHTNMDTFERVRGVDMQQCAIVMASFAYHAATRAEKIPAPPAAKP